MILLFKQVANQGGSGKGSSTVVDCHVSAEEGCQPQTRESESTLYRKWH